MNVSKLPEVYPSVVHMLAEAAHRWPDREAVACGGDRLTYSDYFGAVAGFAKQLTELGASQQRVALVMANSVDICIAMFGVHAAGAQAVPLNPLYTAAELVPILSDAEPHVLIYDALSAPVIATVLEKVTVPHVIELGTSAGRRAFDQLAEALPEPWPAPEDPATLQYTGGTTGVSKGVNLSHLNIAVNISQREALLPTATTGERILSVLPLFHIYGVAMCLHNAVYAGATLVVLPRFTPEAAFELLKTEQITILAGSPTVFVGLMADERFAAADFSQLKLSYSGSAPLPAALLEKWRIATGAPVLEGYGQSESAPVISFNPLHGKQKPGSVGLALPQTDIEIVDAVDGQTVLGAGESGEIRIRGPQVMQGYHNRPAETAQALRNGWLYTGDIGELDTEDYLFIRDRKKDMLIVSGFNVYPREIEELLHRHPKVLEAAVIGRADDYRGEMPHAFVTPAPDCELTAEELEAYCRENLAAYKVPRAYDFVDALPKTGAGKIHKLALHERAGSP